MIEFEFCNNIVLFINELIELLKEDWKKFKIFFRENKNYIICLFIALFTLQITDVMAVGKSYNIYTKKNTIPYGGSNAPPPLPPPREDRTTKPKTTEARESPEAGTDNKTKTDEPEAPKNKAAAEAENGENDTKDVKKKLDLFDKLKGKVKGSAGKHGMMGPVFNNLEGIFSALEGVFTIFALLLIIVGIISLPIFIFLIITYCIIKYIVGKLVLY